MLGRIIVIFALVLGVTAYLAPEPVLYDLFRGLGALLFLPFEVVPVETMLTAFIGSPPSLSFLALFLLGTLVLSLVEFG